MRLLTERGLSWRPCSPCHARWTPCLVVSPSLPMQGSHTEACTNGRHCHAEVSTTQREGHTMDVQEGIIRVDGYRVWYRCVGRGGIPLLLLHGGPGAGHDYLEPLAALAADRQLVFYDQLGCGRSEQPD